MSRRTLAALALAAALAGCPLPQPLPDYPAGTTVTPPRILVDGLEVGGAAANGRPVILVPASCPTPPGYALAAQVFDTNTIEQVDARWFVNYDPRFSTYARAWQPDTIPPDPDPTVLKRTVPTFVFEPYQHPPPADVGTSHGAPWPEAGVLRVVELVVSNGFDPAATAWPDAALPNRTPAVLHETQVYRWVFLSVPASAAGCDPADPACVPCP